MPTVSLDKNEASIIKMDRKSMSSFLDKSEQKSWNSIKVKELDEMIIIIMIIQNLDKINQSPGLKPSKRIKNPL